MTYHVGSYYRPQRFQGIPLTRRERLRRWFERHDFIADMVIVFVLATGLLCVLSWLLGETP